MPLLIYQRKFIFSPSPGVFYQFKVIPYSTARRQMLLVNERGVILKTEGSLYTR